MKTFTSALTLALATIAIAAPAAEPASLDKRAVTGSITVYANANYGGASQVIQFNNLNSQVCVSTRLSDALNNQVSSARLAREGSDFNCRLWNDDNCGGSDATWFFDTNQANLADYPGNNFDNKASSVSCGPKS